MFSLYKFGIETDRKMVFYTIDSRITMKKRKLSIQKVKHNGERSYWLDSFILMAIVIAVQTDAALDGKPYKWVIVLVALTWIYPHLERIFKFLFLESWGQVINLDNVVDVKWPISLNELETEVVVRLRSGRRKKLVFRTAENGAEEFVSSVRELSSMNPSLTKNYS
jgi:hypothetical protein